MTSLLTVQLFALLFFFFFSFVQLCFLIPLHASYGTFFASWESLLEMVGPGESERQSALKFRWQSPVFR